MFAARGGFEYYVTTVGATSFIASFNTINESTNILLNSDGSNIYMVGSSYVTNNDMQIIKMDSSGNVIWQNKISGNTDYTLDGVIDSSENIYLAGYTDNSGAGGLDGYIAKISGNGNMLWQRTLGTSYAFDTEPGISIDPSGGNVYVALSGNNLAYMAKYNSSGTLGFQRQLDSNSDTAYDTASVSGNSYAISQGGNDIYLSKVNDSGTAQYTKKLTSSGWTLVGSVMTTDSTGNIYILGQNAGGGNVFLTKLYSNGAVIASRHYSNNVTVVGGIAIDTSTDNVYISGGKSNTIWYSQVYNSNLVPIWQQTITNTNILASKNISFNNNNLYIAGRANVNGSLQSLTCKLSSNGVTTGTYGNYTFSNVSYTSSALTITSSNAANATTSSLTTGTPNLAVTSTSFTQTLTPI